MSLPQSDFFWRSTWQCRWSHQHLSIYLPSIYLSIHSSMDAFITHPSTPLFNYTTPILNKHIFIYIFIHLSCTHPPSICPPIHLFIHPSPTHTSIHTSSTHPLNYLSIYTSTDPFIHLSITYPSIQYTFMYHASIICLSLLQSTHPSISPPPINIPALSHPSSLPLYISTHPSSLHPSLF